MGKQNNKVEKRQRRLSYIRRKKAATKATAKGKATAAEQPAQA